MKPVESSVWDMHCHIGTTLLGEELFAMMEKDEVDRACVFVTPFVWSLPNPDNYYNTNDYIADMQKKYASRFFAFACVNPWYVGDRKLGTVNIVAKELRRCFTELGMRGIKLHPENHCFNVDALSRGNALCSLMDTVSQLQEELHIKIPILSHGMTLMGCQPDQFAKVAMSYPDINIVIAHGAGFQNLYFAEIDMAKKCPNLYFDTAMLTVDDTKFLQVFNQVGPDKVIFGSDHYLREHVNLYGNFYHVLEKAVPDKKDLEKILGGNLRRIMQLEAG